MIRLRYAAMMAAAAVLLGACASTPSPEAVSASADQPVYSEAEKASMSTGEKAEVYNEQAEEEDRVYCRRETVTGSHRKRTVCRTMAEIKKDSEAARDALWSARKGGATDPGGGTN